MKVIGQGAFGCVIEPSIPCMNSKTDKNLDGKVSKIMLNSEANKEYELAEMVDTSIDPGFYYHLKKPEKCKPDITYEQLEEIQGCRILQQERIRDTYTAKEETTILIYEHGGVTWEDFSRQKISIDSTPQNIQDFLISAYTVVRGVEDMNDKGYVHDDLKYNNVLYNIDKKRSNIIDFGFAKTIANQKKFFDGPDNKNIDYWYSNVCPEYKYMHRPEFEKIRKMSDKETRSFLYNFIRCPAYYNTYERYLFDAESKNLQTDVASLFEFIKNHPKYEDFTSQCINLIDSYGIGFTLVVVTYDMLNMLKKNNSNNNNSDTPCKNA